MLQVTWLLRLLSHWLLNHHNTVTSCNPRPSASCCGVVLSHPWRCTLAYSTDAADRVVIQVQTLYIYIYIISLSEDADCLKYKVCWNKYHYKKYEYFLKVFLLYIYIYIYIYIYTEWIMSVSTRERSKIFQPKSTIYQLSKFFFTTNANLLKRKTELEFVFISKFNFCLFLYDFFWNTCVI